MKLVIEDLAPSDSVQWPRDVLDLLHSCLVEQQLRVELVTRLKMMISLQLERLSPG